jgi:phosphatidylserine/phosphatidylglycerophosphate/cardiolipin synthase-like enzyme
MKYDLKTKILLGVALVVIAGYFWPQYEREMPRTAAEVAQSASAAVAEIPSEVPLTLITEPDDGVGMIREAIQTAAQSLDLVIYELDDRQIEQDLVDAKNRGVAVRVILQNVNSFGKHPNQGAYDFLKSNGVPTIRL